MEQDGEVFTYATEPLGTDEIRLIDIEPGGGDEVISCKLSTFKRVDKPHYKALSYAWGDVAKTHCILLDGTTFWLHRNLHEALYCIRDANHTIRLWTDRICINQDVVAERNAQVCRMGATYAEAEEVLIWLGAGPIRFGGSLQNLRYVIDHHEDFKAPEWTVQWPIVEDIISVPWFKRLWVIQEAVLAKKGTVILGHERCDLQDLLGLTEIDLIRLANLSGKENVHILASGLEYDFICISVVALLRTDFIRRPGIMTQAKLVWNCRGLRCHDVRDYIFATTGMAELLGIG